MNRIASLVSFLAAALLLPAGALAATPANGVQQQVRSGFFADVNMGTFFTYGGKKAQPGASTAGILSNAQAYLQLGIGYDIAKNFALAGSFGLGSSAASCFAEVNPNTGECRQVVNSKNELMPDNFTATMFAAEASYKHFFNERFTAQPRLHLGYAVLDPQPRSGVSGGFIAGLGAGLEYATHMDHFSIGADLYWRLLAGPNINSFAVYPKIKYTF